MSGDPEEPFTLAVATVQETCSLPECNGTAEAVLPLVDKDHASFVWLCADHANEAMRNVGDAANPTVAPQRIPRTCLTIVDGSPCGALVTHTAMRGGLRDEEGRPILRVSSMCKRHAEELIPDDE
jgi:hypothetical protein